MSIKRDLLQTLYLILFILAVVAVNTTAADKLMFGTKVPGEIKEGDNQVKHRCLTHYNKDGLLNKFLERDKPWSLPQKALDAELDDTLHILVLRFNFQYETVDDPNTTGRGHMNLSPYDEDSLLAEVGHTIDPPPHNAAYFSSHIEALKRYYEFVSEGKITLTWDVFPPVSDSIYELPHPMSYYGKCDFSEVVGGLENYFRDAIRLADTTSPEINFAAYESIFLFHAGSDRQNDIGFPETCSDLFTGFIDYVTLDDTVYVDNDSGYITNALLMPETACQDNRATAMNAVIAHEFGHQLGLVDLYSTQTFMSQLGDFALMDNNGFGSGIDYGFPVGRVFGAVPLYPMAWSRAHLGFVDVVDFRQGTDIQLAAAEVVSNSIKVARVPISDKEYYLIENRIIDVDEYIAGTVADSITGVLLGPAYCIVCDTNETGHITDIYPTSEYDFLMPGSGVMIYHVDEKVAGLDYNYDGDNNFDDNQLQWAWDAFGNPVTRFITIVEADGFVNFGGYYRSGYGSENDMYRDDRNNALTPNSNPPTIDNTGNQTHISIDNITRVLDTTIAKPVLMDSLIKFDVTTNNLVDGFPVRAGYPVYRISPIVDDIEGDGSPEFIIVSGNLLSVVKTNGQSLLDYRVPCGTCPPYYDSSFTSIHTGRSNVVPLYARLSDTAFTNPVTGNFIDDNQTDKLVAVGVNNRIEIYQMNDVDDDGQADSIWMFGLGNYGDPQAMTFGDKLFVLTSEGRVLLKDSLAGPAVPPTLLDIDEETNHGICRVGDGLVVVAGDTLTTKIYFTSRSVTDSIEVEDVYSLGPIYVDLDLDGTKELVVGSNDGDILLAHVDSTTGAVTVVDEVLTGYTFTVNPIASDVDLDGYPDIVFGGINTMYAFNHQLTMKTNYPKIINSKYPADSIVSSPISADIDNGSLSEIIFPTEIGNIYSYGDEPTFGFPLSAGEQGIGSAVYAISTDAGLPTPGYLGYLGLDGWFYLWHVDGDVNYQFWPMSGADPSGSLNFDEGNLPPQKVYADKLSEKKFYNYPNPVTDGETTIRYFLSEDAASVTFTIYDLSGEIVDELTGTTFGNVDNEVSWNCSSVTPGVYRCMISAEFAAGTETAFTDISIIR